MKRIVPIVVLVVLVMAGGIYYFSRPQSQPATQVDTSTWKTYTDSTTGFSIKYPPQYALEAQPAPTDIKWGSRTLLTISDGATPTSKPHATPAQVTLQRQPVVASGKIYHTIAEYQQSGTATQMVQGALNPNGELVTVSGTQALLYHFPPAESTGIAGDSYFFIKDDLIYEVGFNVADPYKDAMLQSITWKPTDHAWNEYKNATLGFAMEYPSDVAHPSEVTEPASTDGIFPGAKTVVFFDTQEQQRYVSVWIQQTRANDANGWFKETYGPDGKGWRISTTSTVAGISAVGVSEIVQSIAHDNYDLNFVRGGNAWSLSFDDTNLTLADIEYMRQSFRFLR